MTYSEVTLSSDGMSFEYKGYRFDRLAAAMGTDHLDGLIERWRQIERETSNGLSYCALSRQVRYKGSFAQFIVFIKNGRVLASLTEELGDGLERLDEVIVREVRGDIFNAVELSGACFSTRTPFATDEVYALVPRS